MAREERLKELELEYEEFVKTDSGKRWLDDCKSRNNGQTGDSGDYIYDFYPEVLMWINLTFNRREYLWRLKSLKQIR